MVQYLHFRILKFPLIFASWQPFTTTSSCWSTGRRKSTSTLRWPSQNASGIGRRRQLGLGSLGSCRLRNPGWFGLHLWYLESFLYFFSLKHQWFSNIFCKTGTPEWSRLGIINPGLTSWNIIILFVDQKWPMLESADQPVVGPGDGPFRRTFQRESPACSTSWRSEAHGVAWNAMNSVKLEVNRIDGSALKLFFTPYCQTLPNWFILEFFMFMNVSMKPSKLRQSSFCI